MYDDNYGTIYAAIERRVAIIATYNGQRRLLCPHALGSKKGRTQALFYQAAGGSSSGLGAPGSGANWRCMDLAKLSEVDLYPGSLYSGGNHSSPNT
jgi:hypothetical protein